MTNNPAISVVIPMYNVERYIKFCIDSILIQSFQDFEIILVDDASTDGSVEFCQKLYGDNDKIKLVHHEKNLTMGPARNTAIKHARGKYIAFVDSDDFILPDALEKFYNTAEKNNAQVVHAAGWLRADLKRKFEIGTVALHSRRLYKKRSVLQADYVLEHGFNPFNGMAFFLPPGFSR